LSGLRPSYGWESGYRAEKRLEGVINQDMVVVAEITFWQPNGGRSRGELPWKTAM